MDLRGLARRRPLPAFYLLTFGVSWGLVLLLVGPENFLGLNGAHPSFALAGSAWCLGPSVAGIAMIVLTQGRPGLRDYARRLKRWRVGVRWYGVALLLGPVTATATATLLAFLLASPAFLPEFLEADDPASLALLGTGAGLMIAFAEETGWAGFVTPRLLRSRGILATGLLMGLLWGALHLPLFAGSAAAAGGHVPTALMTVALFFAWLPPYRVLMVWLYARTQSILLGVLMHVPIVFNQYLVNPATPTWEGSFTFLVTFGAALWVIVALLAATGEFVVGPIGPSPLAGASRGLSGAGVQRT